MKIHHFKTITSTNDELVRMAEDGAPPWTVVLADRQTSGRGRGTRQWWSPAGNLHMSILLRPDASPRHLLRLPVLASLALLSSLGDRSSPLQVKWPNDILFDGRKLAGILAESRSEGERVHWAVVGFGVNMVQDQGAVPEEIRNSLAFVSELGEDVQPGELAVRIADSLRLWTASLTGDGWERAREKWTQSALLNRPYIYRDGRRKVKGIPVRLDESGGLVMRTASGEVIVYSGELGETI